MNEALLTALITALGGIITAAITAYFGYITELKKLERGQMEKNTKNKKVKEENKDSVSRKDMHKNARSQRSWKLRFFMASWKILVFLALVLGGIIIYFRLPIFSRASNTAPPVSPNPIATNTPIPIVTNTSTVIPSCPNAKVEYLELLISTGQWKRYYPDEFGKIASILSGEELGTLINLSGNASLIGAGNCLCIWKGSLQGAPFEPISTSGDCGFSVNISSSSEQVTRVDLELTIGNNQPTLFTISLP